MFLKSSSPYVRLLKSFYNLPIRYKQLLGLFTSEVISVIGLVGIGSYLIITAGRAQLVNQAKSELTVAQINYNIKINQMGFGFRGQSDNAAVIAAAKAYSDGNQLSPDLQNQVKQILQNEIEARNIEYATLVAKDRRIIIGANANRQGDLFDPNGLVSKVLLSGKQIKSSEIVTKSELEAENPPLPQGFTARNSLIRYTVTPVKDPDTDNVVGALVSGDIVNHKMAIVEKTLQAFDGGYAAVYQRDANETFSLTTSLEEIKVNTLANAQKFVPLPNWDLLYAAADRPDTVVSTRLNLEGESCSTIPLPWSPKCYTMAAFAIPNSAGQSVAILVRGSSENTLDGLLRDSLQQQSFFSLLALFADIVLAILLGQAIVKPVKNLQRVTRAFSAGNRQMRGEVLATDEMGELTDQFNQMADSIVASEINLAEKSRQQETHNTELKLTIEALEAASRSKDLFFANISHEFRSPLNSILGYLKIIQGDTNLNQRQIEDLQIIQQSGTHLLTLINDILDFSKTNAGKIELNTRSINLQKFLDEIIAIAKIWAAEKKLDLSLNIEGKLPTNIVADEMRLRQVLINLLSNAVKFTVYGEVILKVTAIDDRQEWGEEMSQQKLCFEVIDTGVGMNSQELQKIFQPFEQIGDSQSRSAGTGLGLALSKQLVEVMGGKLMVKSRLGSGSTFSFNIIFPIVETPTIPQQKSVKKILNYGGKRRKLLIVDDKKEHRDLLVKMLKPIGFEVKTATNGKQMLSLASFFKPDLILLDLFMPVKTGFISAKELRSTSDIKDIPIIIITASSITQEMSKYLNCEAVLYKPISEEELFFNLQKCLHLEWIYNKAS